LKSLGILIATRWEAAPLLRAFGFRRVKPGLYKMERDGRTILLSICGIGQEPARKAAYALCDAGAGELVSAGYCGALTPELQVGDLVTDRVATSTTALWSRSDRLALAQRAGAQAVDMETQAIIEAGTRRGVPIRILRVVSDRLGDDVSPLLGNDPTFSPAHIALRLLNPARWPDAYKLWKQSEQADVQLVKAVGAYLRAGVAGVK
jgi:nucleoside phosphorylase